MQLSVTDVLNAPVGIIWKVIVWLGFPMVSPMVVIDGLPRVKPPTLTVTGSVSTTGPGPVATILKLSVPRKVVSTNFTVKGELPPADKATGVVDPAPGQVAPAGATGWHVNAILPE